MSDEERAEVAARLMSKTGKLDEGEVEELREVWEDVCCTHVKAVFGRLARRVGETEAQDLGQEVLADGFLAVCDGPPGNLRSLLLTIADRKVSHLARYTTRHPASAEQPTSSTEKPMSSSSLADRILAERERAEQVKATGGLRRPVTGGGAVRSPAHEMRGAHHRRVARGGAAQRSRARP